MARRKVDIQLFYQLLFVEKFTKLEIKEKFDISESTYKIWLERAKALCLKEVTISSIEHELVKRYNTTDNGKIKLTLLKLSIQLLGHKLKTNSTSEASDADDADALKKILQAARNPNTARTA